MPEQTDTLSLPLDELPDPLPVPCLSLQRGRAPFSLRLRPPGSKSLTNRAVLLASLAAGRSTIRGALRGADDTERMIAAVASLGAHVEPSAHGLSVQGVGGRWKPASPATTLNLENAGTATRFLAAAAALSPSPLVLDGNERMRQRPIGELIAALGALGIEAEYMGSPGCPPVRLSPPASSPRGATISLPTTASSQFISALLLIGPWLPGGLTLRLIGEITSRSYIQMTLGLLDVLGASVRTADDLRVIRVGALTGAGVPAFDYEVEPDASSATYFWAAASLFSGASTRVEGLDTRSLQGDAAFPDVLARMGASVIREEQGGHPVLGVRGPSGLSPIMADLSDMPDAAMTLAVVASFASGRSILRGLGTLRVKESDRIAALESELTKVGVNVQTNVLGDGDAITIMPPSGGVMCRPDAAPVVFDTYHDHRMAMALSLIGLRRPNCFIRNPGCVAKTYPGYWAALAQLS